MKGENKLNISRKISLLAISFILTTAYAITPGIPIMMEQFPEQSEASIQIMTTIPAMSVMIMVLVSSFVSGKIGSKKTVALGLILVSIFGPLPAVLNSFYSILISRMILGVGFGLVNPLAVSLISHFFTDDKKASMMGYRSAAESVGQSVLTLIAGYLLVFSGWRASFLVYLIAIPILILFLVFVPDVNFIGTNKNSEQNKSRPKQKVNFDVLFFASILFAVVATYVGVKVRLSGIMLDGGYGTVVDAGKILSLLTFVGLIAGIFFGKIYSVLKYNLLPVALIVIGVGEIIVAYSSNVMVTAIACIIIGLAYPLTVAFIFTLTSSIAPKNSEVLATSIILFGCNIGAFLAPYGLQLIRLITKNESLTLPFIVYGIVLMCFSVLTFIKLKRYQISEEKINA